MKKVYSDTGPFAIIPEWVLHQDIGPIAIRLYCQLALMADREDLTCFPSREYLAKECNCVVRSIADALKELTKCGAILVEHRRRPDSKELDTNRYTVIRALPQAENRPTPQAENNLVTRGSSNQSTVSSESSEKTLPPPPMVAFFDSDSRGKQIGALILEAKAHGYELDASHVGGILKRYPKGAVWDALLKAQGDKAANYESYMEGVLKNGASESGRRPTGARPGLTTTPADEAERRW